MGLESDLKRGLEKISVEELTAMTVALFYNNEDAVAEWKDQLRGKVLGFVREMAVERLVDRMSEETAGSAGVRLKVGRQKEALEQLIKKEGLAKVLQRLTAVHLKGICGDLGIMEQCGKAEMVDLLECEALLLGAEALLDMQLQATLVAVLESLQGGAGSSSCSSRGRDELVDAVMTSLFNLAPGSQQERVRTPPDSSSHQPPRVGSMSRLNRPIVITIPEEEEEEEEEGQKGQKGHVTDDEEGPILVQSSTHPIAGTSDGENCLQNSGKSVWEKIANVDLNRLKVAQLKYYLQEKGLETTGLKKTLVERLTSAMKPSIPATASPKQRVKKLRVPMEKAKVDARFAKKPRSR